MTSPARTSISDLPRGHAFSAASFVLDAERVRAYLEAVGDRGEYGDVAPPLAAVALGLASLQEQLSLPDGALHTGQEIQHLASVRVGSELTLRGHIAQRSERQGFVISVIEFEIGEETRTAVRARTTIMAPAAA